MVKLTKEEIVIKCLNEKYKITNTNEIAISKNDCKSIGLEENEMSRILFTLQEDDFITIKRKSNHNDFSIYWSIILKSSCIHYFENKSQKIKINRREWIKTYIPIIISLIALIKSFSNELILLAKSIMQLLK